MFHRRSGRSASCFSLTLLAAVLLASSSAVLAQTQRSPSDVVREFYKAMREHRFKDAWSITIYKPAVEGLTAEEMEELRVDFEERAAKIPGPGEIIGEQINANSATIIGKGPVTESKPQ